MSLANIKKYKSNNSIELSDEQFSFQNREDQHSSQIWANQFTGLQQSRDRFIAFASPLPNRESKELREDIIAHCQHNSKKHRAHQTPLTYSIILNLVNQRIQKMAKNKRVKKNWSDEDVKILVWIINKYCDLQGISDVEKDLLHEDWTAIASLIPGVKPESCMFKWLSLKKVNLATNCWGEEESALLASIVKQSDHSNKKNAKDWKQISQRLYFEFNSPDKIYRNAKQCRQHWNCYLNPQLKKGPWKVEQDILLLKCIKQNNGGKKWSEIVRHFNGRTQNALKNRYTLIVEKQKKQCRTKTQLQIVEDYLEKCYIGQFTGEINHHQSQQSQSNSLFSLQLPNQRAGQGQRIVQYGAKQSEAIVGMQQIKIMPINFKSMIQLNKQELQFMQPGVLLNGVFEKTQDFNQQDLVNLSNNFMLKRYKSSKF